MRTSIKNTQARRSLGLSDRTYDIIVTLCLTLFLIIVLYPIIFVLSSSFSSGDAISSGKVILWPVEFTTVGYELVFKNNQIWRGYGNTLFYTFFKVTFTVISTTMVAYVLSRKTFQARGFYSILYIIPMWFGGGLIPTYILMSSLNLNNSRWGYIFMGSGVAIVNMIISRTYFQSSIPGDLLEASKIDGIDDIGYLLKIAIPLAKPVLAVIALYGVVGEWNSYFSPMIYLRDKELQPLQLILRDILQYTKVDTSMMMEPSLIERMATSSEVMKYALIIVSTAPMVIFFPFVQKFFTKGVMIGSLKG